VTGSESSPLGGCHVCGEVVDEGDGLVGVAYVVSGQKARTEWRIACPAIERGEYETEVQIEKRAGAERRSEFLRQVREGLPLLCWRCCVRIGHKLMPKPPLPADDTEEAGVAVLVDDEKELVSLESLIEDAIKATQVDPRKLEKMQVTAGASLGDDKKLAELRARILTALWIAGDPLKPSTLEGSLLLEHVERYVLRGLTPVSALEAARRDLERAA
jgi:hypothetical protein